MMLRACLLTAALVLASAMPAVGDPLCKPVLTVDGITFSNIHQWRRTWTAHIAVDASRCATMSGTFTVDFVRLKEDAPDLPFTEHFAWAPGEIQATAIFAADEAVLDYSIAAAACPCRKEERP
jgi:hypothetical protein